MNTSKIQFILKKKKSTKMLYYSTIFDLFKLIQSNPGGF